MAQTLYKITIMTRRLEFLKEVSPNSITFVGVGALVIDNGYQVLLEQRADCGLWNVPGGRINPGENITTTANKRGEGGNKS